MDLLKTLFASAVLITCTGCQIGYYLHSAYHQSKLIHSRRSITRELRSDQLSADQKRKLLLVGEVKAFAETKLGLASSSNYTSFVQLEEPYVTYIVQAAYARELKPYLWNFPFVGKVPYKGYFRKKLAEEEAAGFSGEEYDTFVRGVTAYSTLGWFQDSVLSSMLRYDDHDLVELIIHETTHTTLFVKGGVDFNERLATFMGHEGMKLYYIEKEGADSPTLKRAANDIHDQHLFSKFITAELADLEKWYADNKATLTPETKAARLTALQDKFNKELKPKLKTDNHDDFGKRKLNNAYLLAFKNYEDNLDDFAKVYEHFGRDYQKTLAYLMTLKNEDKPDQILKEFVSKLH